MAKNTKSTETVNTVNINTDSLTALGLSDEQIANLGNSVGMIAKAAERAIKIAQRGTARTAKLAGREAKKAEREANKKKRETARDAKKVAREANKVAREAKKAERALDREKKLQVKLSEVKAAKKAVDPKILEEARRVIAARAKANA